MRDTLPIHLNSAEIEWFWMRVDRSGSGCWDWRGTRTRQLGTHGGYYGRVALGGHRPDRIYRAHRVAWTLTYGALEPGELVMQTCDNRLCCRPDHLARGDYDDVAALRVDRGRSGGPRGQSNSTSRLTPEQVAAIRTAPIHPTSKRGGSSRWETYRALAEQFGVHPSSIADIRAGKTWRWLFEKGSAASRRAGSLPEPLAAGGSPKRGADSLSVRGVAPARGDL